MRRLHVAQVAPLWYTVPPRKYGGSERIVAHLTNELVARGHKVTLFAAPGSRTKAQRLISVSEKPLRRMGVPWENKLWDIENLAFAVEKATKENFDIIHNHVDMAGVFFSSISNTPILNTFHSGVYESRGADEYHQLRYYLLKKHRGDLTVAFISRRMREITGFHFEKSYMVYNGVDIERFDFKENPDDYYLWVGRMERKKGIEGAIEAANRMGVRLKIAGKIEDSSKNYFLDVIKPNLNKRIEYLGELSQRELVGLYRSAKAFLYPIEWEEPFGLVVVEAMACGTPTVAYSRGAIPELVEDGKTGFVVDSKINELVKAIKKIDCIDRSKVRARAERLFSKERMTDNYEMYSQLVKN